MDEITQGMMPAFANAIWDPMQPWPRVTHPGDYRNQKPCPDVEDFQTVDWGGGRRMRHPLLGDLVYPKPPDITMGVGFDIISKAPTKTILMLDSTASMTFLEEDEDIIITEIWKPDELSTTAEFFYGLQQFWTTLLAPGSYVGWYAPDRFPHPFHIKILSVVLGRPGDYEYEPLKVSDEPWYLRKQLSVSFKTVRDAIAPSGAMVAEGL